MLQAQLPQDLRHAALCVIGATSLALQSLRCDRKSGAQAPRAVLLTRHEVCEQFVVHVRERAVAAVALATDTRRRMAGDGGSG